MIQINDRDVVSYTYDYLSRLDSRILNTLNPKSSTRPLSMSMTRAAIF